MILYITGLIRIFLLRTGTFCFRVQDRCIQKAGAKTGYIVFDFTRENLDDLLGAEVSSGDVLLLLDTINGRCTALDRTRARFRQVT